MVLATTVSSINCMSGAGDRDNNSINKASHLLSSYCGPSPLEHSVFLTGFKSIMSRCWKCCPGPVATALP